MRRTLEQPAPPLAPVEVSSSEETDDMTRLPRLEALRDQLEAVRHRARLLNDQIEREMAAKEEIPGALVRRKTT